MSGLRQDLKCVVYEDDAASGFEIPMQETGVLDLSGVYDDRIRSGHQKADDTFPFSADFYV